MKQKAKLDGSSPRRGRTCEVLRDVIRETRRDEPRPGAPPRFSAGRSYFSGSGLREAGGFRRSISNWTPREIEEVVIKRGIVETTSGTKCGAPFKIRPTLSYTNYEMWLNAKYEDREEFEEK